MTITSKRMTSLLRSEIKKEATDASLFAGMVKEERDELIALAQAHDVVHLVGDALIKSGCELDEDTRKVCEQLTYMAAWRIKNLDADLDEIKALFCSNNIQFIPLKGAVMRGFYPQPWMRTSCDIDILVHRGDLERARELLLSLDGYTKYGQTEHDVSISSARKNLIELHHSISYSRTSDDSLTDDYWSDASPVGDTSEFAVSDAMFYCYHINHMAKHVIYGGCGVRPFLDLWILDNLPDVDLQARRELLEKHGLINFAVSAGELCRVWFEGGEESEATALLSDYILSGGVYGNRENMTAVNLTEKSKFSYLLSRIWIPYDQMIFIYPSLEGKRALLPFYEVRKMFRLFNPKTFRRSAAELKISSNMTAEQRERTEKMLTLIGLKN